MNKDGFTIIELMVVLAVFSILSALAAPSFKNILKQQEVDKEVYSLVAMIHRARSEAIKRNRVVTICRSDSKNTCGGTWSDGWIMFEDLNADGSRSANELLLAEGETLNNYKLSLSAFGSQTYIRFLQNGLTSYHNGTFVLCPQNGDEKFARAVMFSKTSRVRTSQDKDSDGIDENSSGNNLVCH